MVAITWLALLAVPRQGPGTATHCHTGRYRDGGPVSFVDFVIGDANQLSSRS
jgi:hypothetical protein